MLKRFLFIKFSDFDFVHHHIYRRDVIRLTPYLCLDRKYIYREAIYTFNSHLGSQPAFSSTVLMHFFDDITLKIKMFRSRVGFREEKQAMVGNKGCPHHLLLLHFGTAARHCSWSHCTVWHLLSAGLPLASSTCQMLSRTPHSDISVAKIQSPSPRSSGCLQGRSDRTIRDSVPVESPSPLLVPLITIYLLLPLFHHRALGLLSTWTRAAYHWVCGTAHWGCAGSAGTCRGSGPCCWEPPTRCRCCRRADSRSGLSEDQRLCWDEENEDQCMWKESGRV